MIREAEKDLIHSYFLAFSSFPGTTEWEVPASLSHPLGAVCLFIFARLLCHHALLHRSLRSNGTN